MTLNYHTMDMMYDEESLPSHTPLYREMRCFPCLDRHRIVSPHGETSVKKNVSFLFIDRSLLPLQPLVLQRDPGLSDQNKEKAKAKALYHLSWIPDN